MRKWWIRNFRSHGIFRPLTTLKLEFKFVPRYKNCLGQMTLQNDASVVPNSSVDVVLYSPMVSSSLVNVLFGKHKALVAACCTEAPPAIKRVVLLLQLLTPGKHLKLCNVLFISLLHLLNSLPFGSWALTSIHTLLPQNRSICRRNRERYHPSASNTSPNAPCTPAVGSAQP